MNVKEIGKSILYYSVLIVVVLALRHYVFSPVTALGDSMNPTLTDGQKMIGLKNSSIQHFDIVTFSAPDAENKDYIKRVIGLPGDTVEYKNDQLYINEKKYDEPYLNEFKNELTDNQPLTYDFSLETLLGYDRVPEGKLFVLGDNRRISKDSRIIGMIDEDEILTNVKFSLWPLNKVGLVE